MLLLNHTRTRIIFFVFQVTQASSSTNAVKSIEFARRSKSFLVNTADRVIRVYKTADVLKHKEGGGKDPEPGKLCCNECSSQGDTDEVGENSLLLLPTLETRLS